MGIDPNPFPSEEKEDIMDYKHECQCCGNTFTDEELMDGNIPYHQYPPARIGEGSEPQLCAGSNLPSTITKEANVRLPRITALVVCDATGTDPECLYGCRHAEPHIPNVYDYHSCWGTHKCGQYEGTFRIVQCISSPD